MTNTVEPIRQECSRTLPDRRAFPLTPQVACSFDSH